MSVWYTPVSRRTTVDLANFNRLTELVHHRVNDCDTANWVIDLIWDVKEVAYALGAEDVRNAHV